MMTMTETEIDEALAEAQERGWTRIERADVVCALQYSETRRDVMAYLKSWDDDARIEQECDDKAAAWFEDAAYGYPDEG